MTRIDDTDSLSQCQTSLGSYREYTIRLGRGGKNYALAASHIRQGLSCTPQPCHLMLRWPAPHASLARRSGNVTRLTGSNPDHVVLQMHIVFPSSADDELARGGGPQRWPRRWGRPRNRLGSRERLDPLVKTWLVTQACMQGILNDAAIDRPGRNGRLTRAGGLHGRYRPR